MVVVEPRHPPGPPMTLGSMCDAWRVPSDLVRAPMEVSLFGIQCRVWHFIYLATGAVAVSTPKSPDDSSVLLSSGHGQAKTRNRPGDDAWHHARGSTRRKRKPERVGLGPGCLESATMAEQLDEV